jgi:hypothetical protein
MIQPGSARNRTAKLWQCIEENRLWDIEDTKRFSSTGPKTRNKTLNKSNPSTNSQRRCV